MSEQILPDDNEGFITKGVNRKIRKCTLLMLAIITLLTIVVLRLWANQRYDKPKGTIRHVVFRFNPRHFASSRNMPDAESLPDKEFSVSVTDPTGDVLVHTLAEDLFEEVYKGKRVRHVYWEYPCCEIVTVRGTFILRLGLESIEDVLEPGREDGRIRFLYDRPGGHPSPRLYSSRLSHAIVQATKSDPELRKQFSLVVNLLKKDHQTSTKPAE